MLTWLKTRMPPTRSIVFKQRTIFIMPSAQGWGFLLLLLLLWLTATNYENNLLLGTCFLLASLFNSAILYTYRNLSGLRLEVLPMQSVFAGERIEIPLRLSNESSRQRHALACSVGDEPVQLSRVGAAAESLLTLHALTPRRGPLSLPRLLIASTYPLGFFRTWSRPAIACDTWIYPNPVEAGPLPFDRASATGEAQVSGLSPLKGDGDFAGHSLYQAGMGLQRVDWKAWARGQDLLVKDYAAEVDERLWLDWDYLQGSTELRLSQLCDWALKAARQDLCYGLRLPGVVLAPARGESQRLKVLKALAMYGFSAHEAKASRAVAS